MTAYVEIRCEAAAWLRPAIFALAIMMRLGIPLDYEAIVRHVVELGVKAIVERKAA